MTALEFGPLTASATTSIGIDLGRHRSFCTLGDADGQRLVPLSVDHAGLILRWVDGDRSERVTERVLRLAGDDSDEAVEVIEAVARAIFPELSDGTTLAARPCVAIPASFGPACRAAVVAGFNRAGVPITARHLIDRPIAGLSGWLAKSSSARPQGTVLVIDNDGGQLSCAAADLDTRRLLFSIPLSFGPEDDPDDVAERLRVVVEESHRLRATDAVVRDDDWSVVRSHINHVVLTGSGCQHPRFVELVGQVLPEAALMAVRSAKDQAHTVAFGLLNVGWLHGWTACWPTGSIRCNGKVVRTAGPVLGNDLPLFATRGSKLSFTGPEGDDLDVEIGSVRSTGVRIPAELGLTPRLRLLSDGRILLLGNAGTRPLSMRVSWPIVTERPKPLPLRAVGRRPLELADPVVLARPRDDRPHPARAAS